MSAFVATGWYTKSKVNMPPAISLFGGHKTSYNYNFFLGLFMSKRSEGCE